MKPIIYFRPDLAFDDERKAAERHFTVVGRRTALMTALDASVLVIPRYSALPYNQELCEDLEALGSVPINTHKQHCYVADLRNWYYDLGDVTPRTWFAMDQLPDDGIVGTGAYAMRVELADGTTLRRSLVVAQPTPLRTLLRSAGQITLAR